MTEYLIGECLRDLLFGRPQCGKTVVSLYRCLGYSWHSDAREKWSHDHIPEVVPGTKKIFLEVPQGTWSSKALLKCCQQNSVCVTYINVYYLNVVIVSYVRKIFTSHIAIISIRKLDMKITGGVGGQNAMVNRDGWLIEIKVSNWILGRLHGSLEGVGGVIGSEICHSKAVISVIPETHLLKSIDALFSKFMFCFTRHLSHCACSTGNSLVRTLVNRILNVC